MIRKEGSFSLYKGVGSPLVTIPAVKPPEQSQGAVALEVQAVRAMDNKDVEALRGISLHVRKGEILGLAGVSGNGQVELAQVLDGTRRTSGGRVSLLARAWLVTARNPPG